MIIGTQMMAGKRRRPFDPYWHWCELQINADGADGSTAIVDTSKNAKALTLFGDVQLDTSQFAVGTASIQFDGTGDYIRVGNGGAFDFGAGDFYVKLHIKNDGGSSPSVAFIGAWGSSQSSWVLYKNGSSPYLALYMSSNGTSWNVVDGSAAGVISAFGNFYSHVAFVAIELYRIGSTVYIRQNGSSPTTWSISSASLFAGGTYLYIGADTSGGARLTGRIDDIRVLKGISHRYAGESYTFAPRTWLTKEGG